MKAKDLRERSVEDLRELEKSLAKDTFTNRFKNFTNRLDDTSVINKSKRDLARVKTIIHQLELNAAVKGESLKKSASVASETSDKKPAAKKTATAKKKSAK
jgi:large subunit ribosomal protein L29